MFVLAVREADFVANHLAGFNTWIVDLFHRYKKPVENHLVG
jgi:hypothetical protein